MNTYPASIKVAGCQPIESLGDAARNTAAILEFSKEADLHGVALICFPECFLQGYVVDPQKSRELAIALDGGEFANLLSQLRAVHAVLIFGLIEIKEDALYNTAVVVQQGKLLGAYRKTQLLPGEKSIFTPGRQFPTFTVEGLRFGINICYDTNFSQCATSVAAQGARLLLCPANNMMKIAAAIEWKEKHNAIRAQRCRESGLWLLSADVTGERKGRVSYGPT
ncbi:MAG: carbon-nitrogen hydrolase family protein, partial [Caldilineaceae bacterium]|nr:carbon-nitrogen hydrolase family protein [Caldilineaceae bacterium]